MLSRVATGVVFCSIALAQVPARPDAESSAQPQSGVRAGFWWEDYDRDGFPDAFTISTSGDARLLRNQGDGSFADVTLISGLDVLGDVGFAAWFDFDRDGAPDLFVGSPSRSGRLLRNAHDGTFQDVTEFVGLQPAGHALEVQWLDYDLDGLTDLALRTETGEELYHTLPSGRFELVDLGSANPSARVAVDAFDLDELGAASSEPADGEPMDGPDGAAHRRRKSALPPVSPAGGGIALVPQNRMPPGGSTLNIITCTDVIKNQATAACISASSTPTMGWLYPLTINLNVSGAGNVGIGTTTPAARLEVAGTARVTGTLTLAPAGDQALDLASGSLYKSGAVFLHTKGGANNTGLGREALKSVTSGTGNTASGFHALFLNTTGYSNTALGDSALAANASGYLNTATGYRALAANTSDGNTAHGANALRSNTGGAANTAVGGSALFANTTGSSNTATGIGALFSNTTASSNAAFGERALYANTIGSYNTAAGAGALRFNTSGIKNTAVGNRALLNNTSGSFNTASGIQSLASNTSGDYNVASGPLALFSNTIGDGNTAAGSRALANNTSGHHNTAFGYEALHDNVTGSYNIGIGGRALYRTTASRNIGLGWGAGFFQTSGTDNIAIGDYGEAAESRSIRIGRSGIQTRTFIAGIRGVTTAQANAIPVLIDGAGQLGTVSSSRRFKKDIVDMGEATESLLDLRPVRFRYKQEQTLPDGSEVPMEYGLIAEEVAEVFPDLVVYDDDGEPFTVKYHILSSMLLNEMKKEKVEHARALEEQARVNAELRDELARLREHVMGLAAAEARNPAAAIPAPTSADGR